MANKTSVLCCVTALASMLATGTVHADDHFSGAYVVVSNEWSDAAVKVDEVKIKKSETTPTIGLGYTFSVDEMKTLGIKATFVTKDGEFGVGKVGLAETEVKEKSHYSIALEPGYRVNDDLLVFGILAYHVVKPELVSGETSATIGRLSGFGYGLGAKYVLPNHFFLMAEVQKVDFSSKLIGESTIKPESIVTSLGIGYHF